MNLHNYLPNFENASHKVLFKNMEDYIQFKYYDSLFGGMVPLILANGLRVNIVILSSPMDAENDHKVYCEDQNVCDATIYVYKKGDHYDGIEPTSSSNTSKCNSVLWEYQSSSFNCDVKFLVWNINGLNVHKLDKNLNGELMMAHDIILLSETWTSAEQDFYLSGYFFYNFPRETRHRKAKRASGGLGIFIKTDICNGVTVLEKKREFIVWLKLSKSFFKVERDIYVGSVYIPPEGSLYVYDGMYEEIQHDILAFPEDSEVLLVGDYNARTNTCADFISSGGNNGELADILSANNAAFHQIDELYTENLLTRYSMDKCHVNLHGRDLLEFCKGAGFLIVNGRIGEDRGIGEFTRVDTTGSNLVDYVICSPTLFKQFGSFKVHAKLPESDHKPLSYSINCKQIKDKSSDLTGKSWERQLNYKWTQAGLIKIKPVLTDDIGNKNRKYVKEAMVSLCDSNVVAQALDSMLYTAFNRAFGKNPTAKYCNKVTKTGSRLKWFDHELKEKRRQAIKAGDHVISHADKQIHITACRNYRTLRQRKQRDFHRDCMYVRLVVRVAANVAYAE